MSNKKSWPSAFDEALLRVMRQNHTAADPFLAAYLVESGDKVHDIGGIVFRATKLCEFLREGMSKELVRSLNQMADKFRATKAKPERGRASQATIIPSEDGEYITASEAAKILGVSTMQVRNFDGDLRWKTGIHPKDVGDHTRKMYSRASVMECAARPTGTESAASKQAEPKPAAAVTTPVCRVTVDGVVYVTVEEAGRIIGVSGTQVRNAYGRSLTPQYGLVDGRPRTPVYALADVEVVARKRAEDKAAAAARAAELNSESPTIDGVACVSIRLASEIVGINPHALGGKYNARLVRRWHAERTGPGYFTRASVEALKADLDAEAARKVAAPPPSEVPVVVDTPSVASAVKAPIRPMSDLTFPEQLERLNRALAEGVIDAPTHLAKVRQMTAAMLSSIGA